jgi:superfamily I DNA and/or RNA helicase
MTEIQIKTMNIMQEEQALLIIMNLMTCERLNFLQTKNRMNVAFSRAQNDLIVVDDATNIMKEKTKHRRHLKSVIIFIINQNANVKFEKSKTFFYFSVFLDHEYHQNQSIEDQISIRQILF